MEARPGEFVVIKKRFSAFFATHLDLMLRWERGALPSAQCPNVPLRTAHLPTCTRNSPCCAATAMAPRRRAGIKRVVLCGVQTPNCIRATAVDALALDYEVGCTCVRCSVGCALGRGFSAMARQAGGKARGARTQVLVLCDATASKTDVVQASNLEDMRCMGMSILGTAAWASTMAPRVSAMSFG